VAGCEPWHSVHMRAYIISRDNIGRLISKDLTTGETVVGVRDSNGIFIAKRQLLRADGKKGNLLFMPRPKRAGRARRGKRCPVIEFPRT
jgi:hypothetical protein